MIQERDKNVTYATIQRHLLLLYGNTDCERQRGLSRGQSWRRPQRVCFADELSAGMYRTG